MKKTLVSAYGAADSTIKVAVEVYILAWSSPMAVLTSRVMYNSLPTIKRVRITVKEIEIER